MTTCCTPPPPVLSLTEMATSVTELRQVHAQMLKTGQFRDTFTASRLVAFAATNPEPRTVSYAHSIFNQIDYPNSFTWNAIIRAYANSPTPEIALTVFHQMLYGTVLPDNYTFTFVLKACAACGGLEEGKQIHGHLLKIGADCDVFIENTLIRMYGANGYTKIARDVLDRMPTRDVFSWNALLSAFVERGEMELARELFDEMGERDVKSWNFMISGYVGLGLVEEARKFFDEMPVKNVDSWNVMITAYANVGCLEQVLAVFEDMRSAEVRPNNCTLVNVLSACAGNEALSKGKMVHEYIDENEIEIIAVLATALVDMYFRCGSIEKALEVFKNTSRKDVSIWNSIIAGLSNHGFEEHALQIFSEMVVGTFKPNEDTFIGVLSACSHARFLNEGCEIFDHMVTVHGIRPTIEHYGCMVDLLCGVGLLEEAEELARIMPQEEAYKVWESLFGACKNHGYVEMAERVAKKLLEFDPQDSGHGVQLSNMYASTGS